MPVCCRSSLGFGRVPDWNVFRSTPGVLWSGIWIRVRTTGDLRGLRASKGIEERLPPTHDGFEDLAGAYLESVCCLRQACEDQVNLFFWLVFACWKRANAGI